MLVISSREFRNKQAGYFDLVDEGTQIIVQRGKNKSYSINPITDADEDDYTEYIPEEYLCDPFDISPSGDRFWADKRNVEALERSLKRAEKDLKEGKYTVISTEEELNQFLDSL